MTSIFKIDPVNHDSFARYPQVEYGLYKAIDDNLGCKNLFSLKKKRKCYK